MPKMDLPMHAAIRVEKLSKRYQIGGVAPDTNLREAFARFLTLSRFRKNSKEETIWALRDVTFSIEHGETVGIIGRNGAGKSTLLKILSKITYPTSGRMRVNGRVAALLEVGTGFHQELTGRENIYMNGSILGMSKKEVDRKLDQIVAFSGVEKFLDTPIKRYSSGMCLRLGFAVAAHLDPDLLIVDEVLAVGDAAFQKKCMNAMSSLREGSRTVLFVSHNLAAVENLCSRCIWIDGGRVRQDGESPRVIKAYMESINGPQNNTSELGESDNRRGNGKIRFRKVEFLSAEGHRQQVIRSGDSVTMRFHYFANEPVPHPSLGFRMYTEMGTLVTESSTWHHGIDIPLLKRGEGYLDLRIASLNLLPATYALSLWATDEQGVVVYDNLEHGVTLEIDVANIYQSGRNLDSRCGIVYFPQKWDLSGISSIDSQKEITAPGHHESLPQ